MRLKTCELLKSSGKLRPSASFKDTITNCPSQETGFLLDSCSPTRLPNQTPQHRFRFLFPRSVVLPREETFQETCQSSVAGNWEAGDWDGFNSGFFVGQIKEQLFPSISAGTEMIVMDFPQVVAHTATQDFPINLSLFLNFQLLHRWENPNLCPSDYHQTAWIYSRNYSA